MVQDTHRPPGHVQGRGSAAIEPCPDHPLWMNCECIKVNLTVEEDAAKLKADFLNRSSAEKIQATEAYRERVNQAMDRLEPELRSLLATASHTPECLSKAQRLMSLPDRKVSIECLCSIHERKSRVLKGFDILREEVNS